MTGTGPEADVPLQVAVVGAGPAGLAAALMLARDGHAVRIFERFAVAGPVGSGLMLQPTGLAVLETLGLRRDVEALGSRIDRLDGRDAATGRQVLDVRYTALRGEAAGLGIHRAALFQVLYQAVRRQGISLQTSFEAVRLDRGTLSEREGRGEGPFDLVVDASGARSALREASLGPTTVRPLRYGALWATLPWVDEGFSEHSLQQRYRRASVMAGILPVGRAEAGGDRRAAFFWSCRADHLARVHERGLPAWKNEVSAVWPALDPHLRAIEDFGQLHFAAYAHHTVRRPNAERYVAIGDAAHQTSPQLGQGVNMALLDAYALARTLRFNRVLDTALDRYRADRAVHVRFYQAASLLLTPFYQSDSRVIPWLRDTVVPTLARVPPVPALLARLVAGRLPDPLGRIGLRRLG